MGCSGDCHCQKSRDRYEESSLRDVQDLIDELRRDRDDAVERAAKAETILEAILEERFDFKEKVIALLDWSLPADKDYLILYKLEDVLKESRALREENAKLKGVAVESVKVASERTPDDRNCGSEG